MPVQNIEKDIANKTIVITAEFAAPVERVWDVYTNPRQLEKWFGPPGFPATVTDFDRSVGGRVAYYMTSPDGERYHGYWVIDEIKEGELFGYTDGFADADGNPIEQDAESSTRIRFIADGDVTRIESRTTYPSAEGMQKVLDMGVEEGITSAMNQIDALVA